MNASTLLHPQFMGVWTKKQASQHKQVNISLTFSTIAHVLLILVLVLPHRQENPPEPLPIEVSILPAIPNPTISRTERLTVTQPETERLPLQQQQPPASMPKIIASKRPQPEVVQTTTQSQATPERDEPKESASKSFTSNATVSETTATSKAEPAVVQQKELPISKVEPEMIEAPRFGIAYLNNPSPVYPPFSKRKKEQGTVLLKVLVNQDGNAESISLINSSGFERLDQAALETVRRWRFVPAKKNNVAISGYAIVPIEFSLD